MKKRKSKRSVILLEVMIAFFLVVLALLPLIYPHVAIVREEAKMTDEMSLFPKITEFHGELVEKLYLNELKIEQFKGKESGFINNLGSLPYKGTYTLQVDKKKEGKPNSYYLLGFHYTLERNDSAKPLEFHYQLFCQGPELVL